MAETSPEKGRVVRRTGGRYYEEFRKEDVYEHSPARTLTEADNTWFTLLTMNTHPLHFDKEYASKTEFGRRLIVSTLTLSVLVGMSVSDVSEKAIANLGWTDIKLTAPVFQPGLDRRSPSAPAVHRRHALRIKRGAEQEAIKVTRKRRHREGAHHGPQSAWERCLRI